MKGLGEAITRDEELAVLRFGQAIQTPPLRRNGAPTNSRVNSHTNRHQTILRELRRVHELGKETLQRVS